MNERAQIVRENENINTVEKFTLTSIIVAQKNGLCLRRFLSGHYTTGAWSIRGYCPRNYWQRGEFSRRDWKTVVLSQLNLLNAIPR